MSTQVGRERRILLVEDEALIALDEARTLQAHGYETFTVHSGERAVEAVRRDVGIELVLMDIDLGSGIDGTTAAVQILEIRELPIVFLTSHSEKEMVEKVKGITRYGYVLKSAGEFVLIESINMAFELFESRQELKTTERRYRELFENDIAAISVSEMVYGPQGRVTDTRFLDVNPAFEKLTGVSREDAVGRTLRALFSSASAEEIAGYAEVVRTGTPISTEQYAPDLGRYFSVSAFRLEPGRLAAVFTDVTDRVQAERAERRHAALLQQIIDTSPVSIILMNEAGRLRYANSQAEDVLGLKVVDMATRNYADPQWKITDLDGNPFPEEELPFAVVRRTGKAVYDVRHAIGRSDGRRVVLSINMAPVFDERGEFSGAVASLEDVTEEAEDQSALVASEELYRTVTRLTLDIITRYDLDGVWTFVNDAAAEFYGYPREELIGRKLTEFVHPEDREATDTAEQRMRQDGSHVWGFVNRQRSPGGWRTVEWNSAPLYDANGTCVGYQASGRDITQRIEAERRIQGLLEEKELLLQEVHHRIKNDMSILRSLLSLQAGESGNPETVQALEEAGNRVAVMAQVYQRLYAQGDVQHVDARSFVDDMVSELQSAAITHPVDVELAGEPFAISPRLSIALGIILNELLTNAAKYGASDGGASEGGTPAADEPATASEGQAGSALAASGHGASGHALSVGIRRDDEEAVKLTVRDFGPGFPPAVVEEGRYGFGLTIASALARQYGGRLHLCNDNGAVATVTLRE